MNINNCFIDNDKVKIPNSECPADILNVQAQLERAAERLRKLLAQSATERSANYGAEYASALAEEMAAMSAARALTAKRDDFTGKKATIDPPEPVRKNDFVAAAKHTQAEYKRLSRKIRAKSDRFFKVPKAPKFEKEGKSQPPPRAKQPRPTPQRGTDDDVIEMELQPGSGVNDPPIYLPKLSQNLSGMKRPPKVKK